MRHQPHLYLPAPWDEPVLAVPDATRSHLRKVLRYPEGGAVSYTDGAGTVGEGRWGGAAVERGEEALVPSQGRHVTIAVAPPRSKERQRFIVEKLQELEVAEIVWVPTDRTQARPPREDRARAWAVAALEQSRGARLMSIRTGPIDSLDDPFVASIDGDGAADISWPADVTVLIGPEGGLTEAELQRHSKRVSLGAKVLRTETAALVAAVWTRG